MKKEKKITGVNVSHNMASEEYELIYANDGDGQVMRGVCLWPNISDVIGQITEVIWRIYVRT